VSPHAIRAAAILLPRRINARRTAVADLEKLSWDEIRKRYPDEYVILADYAFDDNEDIAQGVVWAHGQSRDAAYENLQRAGERPNPIAVRYTGEVKGGMIGFLEDVDAKD
jgi:hypothetical protein